MRYLQPIGRRTSKDGPAVRLTLGRRLAPTHDVDQWHYVYILESHVQAGRFYTGLTSDLASRLDQHNAGRSAHTASGRPWRVMTYIAFADRNRAVWFERYLKSGSGAAFARRHLR